MMLNFFRITWLLSASLVSFALSAGLATGLVYVCWTGAHRIVAWMLSWPPIVVGNSSINLMEQWLTDIPPAPPLEGLLLWGGSAVGLVVLIGLAAHFVTPTRTLIRRLMGLDRTVAVERISDSEELYPFFDELSSYMKVKAEFWICDSPYANAFALSLPGRNLVIVNRGLIDLLSFEPQQAVALERVMWVIAHELAHIRNHDSYISTINCQLSAALTFAGRIRNFLVQIVLSLFKYAPLPLARLMHAFVIIPVNLVFVVLGISESLLTYLANAGEAYFNRQAEFRADHIASCYINPVAGVEALSALDGMVEPASVWRPVRLLKNWVYSTHPSLDTRIKRIQSTRNYTGATNAS